MAIIKQNFRGVDPAIDLMLELKTSFRYYSTKITTGNGDIILLLWFFEGIAIMVSQHATSFDNINLLMIQIL